MDIFEIEYMADEDTHRRLSKAVAKNILTGIDEGEAIIVGKLNGDKTMLFATDLFNRDAIKVLFDGIEYIYKEDKYVPIEAIVIDKDVEAILNEEADILLTDDERAELEPINDKDDKSNTNEAKNESGYDFDWTDYQDGTMGGFMKALAHAFDLADMKNLEKLYKGFPEIYEKYAKFHGDVLKVLRGKIVDLYGLKEGKKYIFMQDFLYGNADDYFDETIDPEYFEKYKDQVKVFKEKYINSNNEIEVPAGTEFLVTDTGHGAIYLEIEGLEFPCIFENDEKFEEVI